MHNTIHILKNNNLYDNNITNNLGCLILHKFSLMNLFSKPLLQFPNFALKMMKIGKSKLLVMCLIRTQEDFYQIMTNHTSTRPMERTKIYFSNGMLCCQLHMISFQPSQLIHLSSNVLVCLLCCLFCHHRWSLDWSIPVCFSCLYHLTHVIQLFFKQVAACFSTLQVIL